MKQPLWIQIASPPDGEFLVAEVWLGEEMWGELNQEEGGYQIEIYSRSSGEPWRLEVEELIAVLGRAKRALARPSTVSDA